VLSPEQPAGCLRITLGHELSHDAARRLGLVDGVPTWAVRAEMEHIAALVEARVADDGGWSPNCLMRRPNG
jgi:hypothetical protein